MSRVWILLALLAAAGSAEVTIVQVAGSPSTLHTIQPNPSRPELLPIPLPFDEVHLTEITEGGSAFVAGVLFSEGNGIEYGWTAFPALPDELSPPRFSGWSDSWRTIDANPLYFEDEFRWAVLENDADSQEGRIRVLPSESSRQWRTPGRGVALAFSWGTNRIAVLCRTDRDGPVLHVRDFETGQVVLESLALAPGRGATPHAIAAGSASAPIYVASSALDGDEPITLLHGIDAESFNPIGNVLVIPGHPDQIEMNSDGECWVTSRTRASGFGYAHLITRAGDELTVVASFPFTGVQDPVRVASQPVQHTTAVSVGNRLMLDLYDGQIGKTVSFDSPIDAADMDRGWPGCECRYTGTST